MSSGHDRGDARSLPSQLHRLTNARLADGSLVDIEIDGEHVVDVVSADGTHPNGSATASVDLSGYLLLTAGADAHAHLDKALSWSAIEPPMGDLATAVASWHAYQEVMDTPDILLRARSAARKLLSNGVTAVRSHVDVLPGSRPLRGVAALLQLREELRGLMHIELVASGGETTPDAVIDEALDMGVDLLGGAPHFNSDPLAELRRLVAIAERRGVSIDLHTDEALDGEPTLDEYARLVREWPADRRATAGHCVRQGTLHPSELNRTIDALLASGMGVVTLPMTNLYLQGRDVMSNRPRGITALRELIDRGVMIGAGGDNVRDPFNPLGRSDPFETAMLLVVAGHLSANEAWHLVSDGSRAVMGLPRAGAEVGAQADFIAVRGQSLIEVIAEAPADRMVISGGRIVFRSSVTAVSAFDDR